MVIDIKHTFAIAFLKKTILLFNFHFLHLQSLIYSSLLFFSVPCSDFNSCDSNCIWVGLSFFPRCWKLAFERDYYPLQKRSPTLGFEPMTSCVEVLFKCTVPTIHMCRFLISRHDRKIIFGYLETGTWQSFIGWKFFEYISINWKKNFCRTI